MGGSVSSGRNNNELIDNLVEGGLIKTKLVESVFRAVDRGTFYLPNFKDAAYRDLAWREGHIHISAPCIYTRVMEALELEPNLSFLNIGSGTGYFSTMVGLILGENGVNHNIELHKDIIDYGKQRITDFVKTAVHFDDFDFCVPKFVNGNVLNLNITDDCVLYDRIYVGVGVTDEHEQLMKSLIKVGGVIVMPLNDNLVKIKKVSEDEFETASLMTVSFASLVTENVKNNPSINLPQLKPLTLQEICRFQIRKCIRNGVSRDYSDYYEIKRQVSTFNKRRLNEQKQSCNINNNDDESDGDSNAASSSSFMTVCPLSRFERLFTPRRNQLRAANLNERTNTYFENQLRMMIYGRLLEPATTNNMLAYVPSNNNDDEDENEDEEEKEDVDVDEENDFMSSPGEENSTSKNENDIDELKNEIDCVKNSLEEIEQVFQAAAAAVNSNASSSGIMDDAKMEEEVKETEIRKPISKEISIPNNTKTEETKNSISESGFSETSESTMSFSLSNSSGTNDSIRSIVKFNANNDAASSLGSTSDNLDLDSKMSKSSNDSKKKITSASQSSSNNHSSDSDEEESEYRNEFRENRSERSARSNCKYEKRSQDPLCSKLKEEPEEVVVRVNHLRNRILSLPLSTNLKSFLLYNRDI